MIEINLDIVVLISASGIIVACVRELIRRILICLFVSAISEIALEVGEEIDNPV